MLASFVAGGLVGAGLAYVFDPDRGRSRRHAAHDRAVSLTHQTERDTRRKVHVAAAQARGRSRGLLHRMKPGPRVELDDAELSHKVESILFRDPKIPKGQISLNAENGCVFLRGQVESSETIAYVEEATREIRGVRAVENLLHPPGTPAPHPSGGALLTNGS